MSLSIVQIHPETENECVSVCVCVGEGGSGMSGHDRITADDQLRPEGTLRKNKGSEAEPQRTVPTVNDEREFHF